DDWQFGVSRFKFGNKPHTLRVADLPSFRTIAVHTDNRDQRRVESPKNIRLSHSTTGRVAIVWADNGGLGAEIANKRVKTLLARGRINVPIVISGDRYNRCVIVDIRFIKFGPVVRAFSIVINHVPQMVKKGGTIRHRCTRDVKRHEARNAIDVGRRQDASRVTNRMKDKLFAIFYRLKRRRIEDCLETHWIRREPARGGQIPPWLRWILLGINYRMETGWHLIRRKGMSVSRLGQVALMGS